MTDPTPEIAKMWVLSTSHLRSSTCNEWLAYKCHWSCVPKGEYGWFMYVPDEIGFYPDVPHELVVIIHLARAISAEWVMFDCDGPTYDGLVVHNW